MDEDSSARLPSLAQVPAIVDQHTVGTAELLLVASVKKPYGLKPWKKMGCSWDVPLGFFMVFPCLFGRWDVGWDNPTVEPAFRNQ